MLWCMLLSSVVFSFWILFLIMFSLIKISGLFSLEIIFIKVISLFSLKVILYMFSLSLVLVFGSLFFEGFIMCWSSLNFEIKFMYIYVDVVVSIFFLILMFYRYVID